MKKKIIVLLCTTAILLSGCIKPTEDNTETTTFEERETYPVPEDETYVYATEVNETVFITGLDSKYLMLVNKKPQNSLGQDFIPAPLTTLTCKTYLNKEIQLESRVASALYEMLDEMHVAGNDDIMVTSGYRDYLKQRSLYNQYVQNEISTISSDAYKYFGFGYIKENYLDKGLSALSTADAKKVAHSYSALPGSSEHQTGLCVDFITSTMDGKLTEEFENTPAFIWLRDNAYKFGFILRYPEGKENVTEYTYEPWHYRFVGREAATIIHANGITLEEYLNSKP